jgi:hypothetical protein
MILSGFKLHEQSNACAGKILKFRRQYYNLWGPKRITAIYNNVKFHVL